MNASLELETEITPPSFKFLPVATRGITAKNIPAAGKQRLPHKPPS